MALGTNIVRRGARYYARVRVPKALVITLKREEVWKSLGTADAQEARRIGPSVVAAMHAEWRKLSHLAAPPPSRLRSWTNDEDARPVIQAYSDQMAAFYEELAGKLAEPPRVTELTEQDLRRYAQEYYQSELAHDHEARLSGSRRLESEWLEQFNARDTRFRLTVDRLNGGEGFSPVADHLKVICARDGIPMEIEQLWGEQTNLRHPLCRRLEQALLRAHLELLRRQRERDEGRYDGMPTDPLLNTPTASPAVITPLAGSSSLPVKGETLRTRVEEYLRERGNTLSAEWIGALRATVELFLEFAGEGIQTKDVTRELAKRWKQALHSYPSRGKIRYPKMTFAEILDRNTTEKRPVLSARSINKYLTALSTLFDWIVRHEHDGVEKNPFADLRIEGEQNGGRRDPFVSAQLKTLFTSPLFTGCASDPDGLTIPGEAKISDWRYWLPLLCLYTGARLGELAQLTVDDVRTRDGIAFISINDSGEKRIKTQNASRIVPIHPNLLRIGFVDYVDKARSAGQSRIFPEILPDSLDRMASVPSKFFARYFSKIGIKTDHRLTVHSFRHSFVDALREAGYDDRAFAPLIGHGTIGAAVTAGYGSGPSLPIKARYDMIKAVTYDLDLSHLIPVHISVDIGVTGHVPEAPMIPAEGALAAD